MIVRQQMTLLTILFGFRLSILSKVWPRVLLSTAISAVITAAYLQGVALSGLTVTPFSLIGVALGIFLGFRTNASYDRFWEGRRLWGRLVNCTRTLTRQLELFLSAADAEDAITAFRREQAHTLIAYTHAFRGMLRRENVDQDLQRMISADLIAQIHQRRNPPNALVQTLAGHLREAWRKNWISDFHLSRLDQSLEELTSIQGGCERILNTPVPFSYSFLIHRITAFYCFLLPFGIVGTVGAPTPLVSLLIAYAFFGLDAIGDEVEDPFGIEPNDLPLTAISRNIEIDILEMIGEANVPIVLQPEQDILI